MLVLICLIAAAILAALATFGVAGNRFNLFAAALFFLILAFLIPALSAAA